MGLVFPDGLKPQQAMERVVRGNFMVIPKGWKSELKNLVADCLEVDAAHRPSATQIFGKLDKFNYELWDGINSFALQTFLRDVRLPPHQDQR
jgi:hypothetical protein